MITTMINRNRRHRYNKIFGDGDPWLPNNITENLKHDSDARPTGVQNTEGSIVINHDWIKTKYTDC